MTKFKENDRVVYTDYSGKISAGKIFALVNTNNDTTYTVQFDEDGVSAGFSEDSLELEGSTGHTMELLINEEAKIIKQIEHLQFEIAQVRVAKNVIERLSNEGT